MNSRLAAVAAQLFGILLLLLPRRMRLRHGAEMRADFAELLATQPGRGVVLRSVVDLLRAAPSEWRAERRLRQPEPGFERERLTSGDRMHIVLKELGQAARSLSRRPGFALVAVLTLALGIGANVAIFAVVNSILIRPLPYPESERIVSIRHHAPGLNLDEMGNSPGTLSLYREHARSYGAIGGSILERRNLTGAGEAARIGVVLITSSMFEVLGVRPAQGRALIEADAEEGAAPVAVLSHSGWQDHFGGASDVVGRHIELNGVRTEVVGVMPRGFAFPERETVLLLPLRVDARDGFGTFGTEGLARLANGVTVAAAEREANALRPKISELYPDVTQSFLSNAQWRASVETMHERTVGDSAKTLWIVLGTVGFLLLVACASVANLFLVRAESRQKEISVRIALGASRARVAASFLHESLLLGLTGGALGLVFASVAVRVLVALGPQQLPRLEEVSIDGTVLLFGATVSVLASLLFGILPLLRHARGSVTGLSESRGSTAGRDRQGVRKVLIVTQIALAIVLLTGSLLMLQSFQRLRAVDPGIRSDDVLTVGISLGTGVERTRAAALYQEIVDAVSALPGVEVSGVTNSLPLAPTGYNGSSYYIQSKPRAEDELPPVAMYAAVSEGFMESLGVRLVAGRNLERGDHEHERNVIVINEHFANTMLDGDAIGEMISFSDDSIWHEVVGVVGDVRTFGIREDIRAMAYVPMTARINGVGLGMMTLTVKSAGDAMSLAGPVRAAIRSVTDDAPILDARSMEQIVDDSMADTSFMMTILIIAAVVSLLLGAVGLYGVIGYVVSQRTREIGLRMALGAVPAQVRSMVMSQGLVLSLAGIAIGLAGAVSLVGVLESVLYEVDSRDPATFFIVPGVLLAVSALAAWLPARRASIIQPLDALRSD